MKTLSLIATVLVLLTGCVVPQNYSQVTYDGMSKYDFFDKTSSQSLDFQQIYYDGATGIEVFFLHSANWWNGGDVGTISVFESVSRPTDCPFASHTSFKCVNALFDPQSYGWGERAPYMGNGRLKATYQTDELAVLSAQGDVESSYLLAAYQIYNERRNAEIDRLEASSTCMFGKRICAEVNWLEKGWAHDELMAKRKAYRNRVSSTPIKSSVRASTYGSRVNKTGHSVSSKGGSSLFNTLIDAAITGWIHKEFDIPYPGEISKKNLKKIEDARYRGMKRAMRCGHCKRRAYNKSTVLWKPPSPYGD